MHKDSNQSLFIGNHQVRLPSCHSTNQVASDLLAANEATHGTVVITENQTRGRGQRGSNWESQPGKNLTFSVILTPTFLEVGQQFNLNIVASLALTQTLQLFGLNQVQIKWPNDVFCHEAKISGILIENSIRNQSIESSILGIGLNVNQKEFKVPHATSMVLQTGKEETLDSVFEHLLKSLEYHYHLLANGGYQELRDQYTSQLYRYQEPHSYKNLRTNTVIHGFIQGIDQQGRLQLHTEQGNYSFEHKEVQFL